MDGNYSDVAVMKLFIIGLMLAAVFLALIPGAFQTYLRLKKTRRPIDFSSMIFLATLAGVFIFSIYPMFIHEMLKLIPFLAIGMNQLIVYTALLLFLFCFSLPQTWAFFQRWRTANTAAPFSTMIFFATMSFYCLSALFMPSINAVIKAST